jgi:hypothetical protein
MMPLQFPPSLFMRFAEMASFTIAFGITGFIFLLLFLDIKALQDLPESAGLAISAGLILVIVLVFALNFLGIPITKTNVSIAFMGVFTISIFRLYKKKPAFKIRLPDLTLPKLFESLLPLIIFFIVLAVRTSQIKDIFVPNWYDGLIHTSLLNRFLSNAKFPLDGIYHIGFHTIVLAVNYYWGLSLPETILILGQWLSAVGGLTFYYLVLRYTKNHYVAGVSQVAYSLFLLFPSYLTSLGRYPFLLGITLLPLTILTSLNWITNKKSNYMIALLFIAALSLAHYGALLFWFAFIFVSLVSKMTFETRVRFNLLRYENELFLRPALLVLPIFFIILPKAINLINHPFIMANIIARAQDPSFGIYTQALLEKFQSKNYFFFFLWIIWLPWAFVRKRRFLFITVLWPLAGWFFTWAQYQIAGFSISTYVNLIIFLCMPLAYTFGLIFRELLLCLRYVNSFYSLHFSRNFLKGLPAVLLIIGMLFGIYSGPQSIDLTKTLFTNDDMLAMNWIENNTPRDAAFMVRTIIWSNQTLVPYDGGGWITYTTGRRIIIPQIGELYDICEFSKLNGVNYIYFGNKPLIKTFDLRLDNLSQDSYLVAYQNQSVKIYSLNCP